MGNKLSAGAKPGKRGGAPSSLSQQGQQSEGVSDEALAAELRAAHEATLRLAAGVNALSEELALEQKLAAIDDEAIDDFAAGDGQGGLGDGDEDLAGLDPEELAELEGELQELEREVLGLEEADSLAVAAAVGSATLAAGTGGRAAAAGKLEQEHLGEQGLGQGQGEDAPLPAARG